jgi:hypothetical protein
MDHDLGDDLSSANGYSFLAWALEETHLPKPYVVVLVTANPVGRDNMERVLLNNGYDKIRGEYILVRED